MWAVKRTGSGVLRAANKSGADRTLNNEQSKGVYDMFFSLILVYN